jgi:hypothetical protein
MSSRPKIAEVVQKGLRLDRAIRLVWNSVPGWTRSRDFPISCVSGENSGPVAGLGHRNRRVTIAD